MKNSTTIVSADPATETAIRTAVTIGNLERLAGITDRVAFWNPYARMAGETGLDAGVAELKRIIRANAAATVSAAA